MKNLIEMKELMNNVVEELQINRSDWNLVKFGDVAIQQKKSVDRENTELTRYVKGEHMGSEDLHLREWGELTDEYLGPAFIRKFEKGNILYGSRRTYLRKVVIAPFDGITSNTTFVIKANEKRIDERLLPFIMLSEGFAENSIRNSKGSVNPYINWKDIAGYEFLLPPKEQQAQLAELLWAMDEVIEKEVAVLGRLEDAKFALQRGYLDNRQFGIIKIEELAKVYSGGTPSRKIKEYWNGNIPWIKTAEVNYETIKYVEEYITEDGLRNSAAKIIPEGAVLVAMYGQGITRGRVALTGVEAACNQACAVIETKDIVDSNFIYAYLEYKYEELRALAHGANQQNLNLAMVKEFSIPNLDKGLIKSFLKKKIEIDSNLNKIKSKIASSKTLQKSLINQIF